MSTIPIVLNGREHVYCNQAKGTPYGIFNARTPRELVNLILWLAKERTPVIVHYYDPEAGDLLEMPTEKGQWRRMPYSNTGRFAIAEDNQVRLWYLDGSDFYPFDDACVLKIEDTKGNTLWERKVL